MSYCLLYKEIQLCAKLALLLHDFGQKGKLCLKEENVCIKYECCWALWCEVCIKNCVLKPSYLPCNQQCNILF